MKTDMVRQIRSRESQGWPIVVVIVDDHPIAADGLKSYLETTSDIRVAAICHTAVDALEVVAAIQPDVVLLDVRLDGSRINGLEVAQQLRRKFTHQQLKILLVSAYCSAQYVFDAVAADVDGYILKSSKDAEIIEAVYAVMQGIGVWDRNVKKVLNGYNSIHDIEHDAHVRDALNSYHSLTPREKEVLALIAANYQNDAIAANLYIVSGTVKQHVNSILRKLALKDRRQLQVWYRLNRDKLIG
ncbi:MAG: response regulator transcription factor [Chloroflexi bacterium]|nr:response regulator transcription factor [Chloroflexota bacterium]